MSWKTEFLQRLERLEKQLERMGTCTRCGAVMRGDRVRTVSDLSSIEAQELKYCGDCIPKYDEIRPVGSPSGLVLGFFKKKTQRVNEDGSDYNA
jgi:hypothetical protein